VKPADPPVEQPTRFELIVERYAHLAPIIWRRLRTGSIRCAAVTI
jgi:hypothetical protein